jgi:hypothetical protein
VPTTGGSFAKKFSASEFWISSIVCWLQMCFGRIAGVGQVGLEVVRAETFVFGLERIEDQLVGPARVLARGRLAVRPGHVLTDVEGVGHAIARRIPFVREAGGRLEIRTEADEQVVVEGIDLVVDDQRRKPRVEDLQVLVGAGTQHEGFAVCAEHRGRPRDDERGQEQRRRKGSKHPGTQG